MPPAGGASRSMGTRGRGGLQGSMMQLQSSCPAKLGDDPVLPRHWEEDAESDSGRRGMARLAASCRGRVGDKEVGAMRPVHGRLVAPTQTKVRPDGFVLSTRNRHSRLLGSSFVRPCHDLAPGRRRSFRPGRPDRGCHKRTSSSIRRGEITAPSIIGGVCATFRDAKSGKVNTPLYYIGSLNMPPTFLREFAGESGNGQNGRGLMASMSPMQCDAECEPAEHSAGGGSKEPKATSCVAPTPPGKCEVNSYSCDVSPE